jgi:aspartyl-tRNA(Asn)/glutamyl-tRNA(Gln) amidotransferase subunit A
MDISKATIEEVSSLLNEGRISSVELTKKCLDRIDKVEEKIDAFIAVDREGALEQAQASDIRRKQKKVLSKLDGVPVSIKDLFCQKDVETTAASNILKGFIPPYDATVVKKIKEAGMVILGKNNLDAFAHGSSTENSDFKTTKNPWDLSRVPGGSSGGSAAAVASGEVFASLGTDTGGSIRQPASLCSVVGLKPTYGRVSRYGVIAMASSLDVVGPIAKTARDIALILEIIAGKDDLDATTLDEKVPHYSEEIKKSIKGKKIAIPREYFASGMDRDVEEVVRGAIKKIESLGVKIVEVSMPYTKYALETYYIIQPAEVSSNLSRYNGIGYGYSSILKNSTQSLDNLYKTTREEGFGAEAKRRIMLGTYVLSAGYYDAYYKKALKLRTLVKKDFDEVFKKAHAIVTPVSPTPAFKIGEKSDDPVKMYLSDIYTVPINPAGVPAISTPAGFVNREGKNLPVGIQIIAPSLGESTLLNISHQFERVRGFDDNYPQL